MNKTIYLGCLIARVSLASDGKWCITTSKDKYTMLSSLHLIERRGVGKAVQVVLGPLSVIIGRV